MAENETSQGLTRREMIKRGALLGGTVMWVTPVVQTVGMSRALAASPSPACVPQWATSVTASSQGTRKDGSAVLAERSNPNNALGQPTDPPLTSVNFFSLGFGGIITVRFDTPVSTAEADVLVVETTNGTYPEETALVEVSEDGTTFFPAGTANNQPTSTSTIDLSGVAGITAVQYVRITDTTNAALHTNDADAFDVNAVGISCPT
jgi:hypothetical protein